MSGELVAIGKPEAVYTHTGHLTGYRLEIRHNGLHEYRLLRAPDQYVLQNKATTQIAAWDEKWRRTTSKAALMQSKVQSKDRADTLTKEAVTAVEEARNLLASSLKVDHGVPWAKLRDRRRFALYHGGLFPNVKFEDDGRPIAAVHRPNPPEPLEIAFPPLLGIFDKVFPGRRRKRKVEAKSRFDDAHTDWRNRCDLVEAANRQADEELAVATLQFIEALRSFEEEQASTNRRIAHLKERYEAMEAPAVTAVAELILNRSKYPDWISRDFTAAYTGENRMLILDYTLPEIDVLPNVSKVVYIATRNEMRTTYLGESEKARLYDRVLYQLALRSIHELIDGDKAGAIRAVVFNGWLTWINKGTGIQETGCLLSLQCARDEFLRIDLSKVDPQACFKQLKGVSAAKLSGITPIAPIARINTDDPRFVASYEVANHLDAGVNLAAIDWEDFEHLVREIFEREFASEGGEVKVTRASADGGVDAVVFDPDPIRGGKIIIQAKRYTATVGVSAVRDLYGTMMNEGAMKGILVTTSDYGPDSYAFAKDKPITLLSGGNLLQLMEKNGHRARIDLAEARRLREAG